MFCVIFINSCVCVVIVGKEWLKFYEEFFLLKDYVLNGEYSLEYDYDVFFGDMKDEYDELLLEEVKKWFRVLVKWVDFDKDGLVIEEELIKWVKEVFIKWFEDGVEEDVKMKDENKDGKIIWEEYSKNFYGLEELEDGVDEEIKKMLNVDRWRFDIVDKDKDGFLIMEEFVCFMYLELLLEMEDIYVLEIIEGWCV